MNYKYVITCALLVSALSCSGGGNPIAPSATDNLTQPREALQVESNRVLFGAWFLEVPPDHSSVEVIPVRAALGHYNVRTFLEDGPCHTCLSVVGIHPQPDNVLEVDVRISHPFVGVDTFTGFDVRGTVIFPATAEFPSSGLTYSRAEDGGAELLNPDGWTSLFNPIDFAQDPGDLNILSYQRGSFATELDNASTLNAFKAFYREPDRRPFYTTDVLTKTYSIKLPDGALQFGYVVDASWEPPSPNPPENVPDDFAVTANSLDAYRISASVGEGLNESGGIATCEVEVYDWQGTATISTVGIEAPDLFDGTVYAELDSDFGTISRWDVKLENAKLPAYGDYPVLVSVEDIAKDPFLGILTSYFITSAHVGLAPGPPPGVYVDRDYPGIPGGLPELGTPDAPFRSVHTGILAAQPGATVHVDPSSEPYDEQVVLKSHIILIGENWRNDGDSGKPIIVAMDRDSSIYAEAVGNVTIENLEIRPGGDLEADFLYGIMLDYNDPYAHQENVTVRNCLFTGDRVHTGNNTGDEVMCCQVYLTDNFVFEDNVITDCHVGSDQGGYFGGLHVDVCDGVIIRRNLITECTFRNSFLGMHVWYSDLPVLVEDNEVSYMNNSDEPTGFTIGWAINVIGYDDVTVRHNVVHDLGGPGHRLETVGLFFRCVGDRTYYNWDIENNLIYNLYAQDADNTYNSADCRGIMFRVNSANHLDGLRIVNNTLAHLTSGEYVTGLEFDLGGGNMLYNYQIENNIFYDIQGPAEPDDYYDSGIIYAYWPSDDLLVEYSLFDEIDIPNPTFYGVDEGEGLIFDEDPLFTMDYHLPIDSPAQLGDPTFVDYDDSGDPSGDPDNMDPETRSRMGAYGGPGGDW
jgi:hypothetical protein